MGQWGGGDIWNTEDESGPNDFGILYMFSSAAPHFLFNNKSPSVSATVFTGGKTEQSWRQ